MKKLIAALLTFVIIFALAIPVAATGATGSCGDNAVWTLNNGTLTISGTGPMYDHNNWGNYQNQIRKVVVEEGITSIGYCTFAFHANLEEVTLPDTLTTIGTQAFQGCDKLVSIMLPKNVSKFYTQRVGSSAASVFSGDSLSAIEVHPDNPWFSDVDGVLFDKEMKTLLCYPLGKTATHYTVPNGVQTLAYGSFWFARCTIDLPDSLQVISACAFSAASFTNIHIPNSVTKIEEDAFANCDQLTQITLPRSVEALENGVFASCEKLESITFENPDCVIVETQKTIDPSVIMKGHLGSTAESYAKRFGRTFIDLESGKTYRYNLGNAGLLALLPTDISATAATFCNITSYSGTTGEIVGYQPELVLETNPQNASYQEMLSFVNNLTANCSNDYSKAKVISQWVSNNMTYRFGLMGYGHTAQGVYKLFKNLEGNCECYTQLTNFMLHLAGIPSATASSYGHCWSLALLNGRWVNIDSTNGLFDRPDDYYDDILQIVFTPDDEIVCIVDDLSGVKLASYGLSVTDNYTVREISIPDYITHIYDSILSAREYGEGNPHVTIRGSVGGCAYKYVTENLPQYMVTISGNHFSAQFHEHNLEWRSRTPATCTTSGTKSHYACSDCGKLFSNSSGTNEVTTQSLTIPALGHSYDTYSQDETSHWRCCFCGVTTAKEQHNYGAWETITAATENQTGIQQRRCSDCGHIQTELLPKLPHTHDMKLTSAIAPTHTHPGNTKYYTCSKCHNVYSDAAGSTPISLTDTYIPALGHDYGDYQTDSLFHWSSCSCGHTIGKERHTFSDWEITIAPTEANLGNRQRVCIKCGYDEAQQIPVLAHSHNMELIAAVEATHTQEGHIAYYACTKCHNLYLDPDGQTQISLSATTIPILAHSYHTYQNDSECHWQSCSCGNTTNPEAHIYTPWTEGLTEMSRNCTLCGYTQSQPLPQPPVVSPEPPVVSPEPPVVSPEPPVVSPEPPVVSPEPPVVSPEPPVVSPEPPVVSPEPPVVSPEPPVTPTAPSAEGSLPATAPSENTSIPSTPAEPTILADTSSGTDHTTNNNLILWIIGTLLLFALFVISGICLLKKKRNT